MPAYELVSIMLLVAGAVDVFLAQKILPQRLPEQNRAVVTTALTVSGLVMMALGTAIYYRLIPLGS